jgi:hypothetical protein
MKWAMKRSLPLAALAALGFVATTNAASNDLQARVTASDGWVAYRVPKVANGDGPCCFSIRGGDATRMGCSLDGNSWSFGTDRDGASNALDDTLAVYLRVKDGRVERVRALTGSCPVQTASTVRWIESVDPASSVAMLSSLLGRTGSSGSDVNGLAALAYHADASATRALATRAEPSHSFKEREQALFWLGQARGAEGAAIIERYATTDRDPKLREKAIFALSQSHAPDAYAQIVTIARSDPVEKVRGEALFWLAQMDDSRAKDDIIASLKAESSEKVREKAVFALSQLDDGADDALIAVLRGDYPREVKKQAVFWLGQSGSPRALEYFDEALK